MISSKRTFQTPLQYLRINIVANFSRHLDAFGGAIYLK